jgi:hypothetical protein
MYFRAIIPVVGKSLDVAEERGGSFASFWMQCTSTPGTFCTKIATVVDNALSSCSQILDLSFMKDMVRKWGPGPAPFWVVPLKKSGSTSMASSKIGGGFITPLTNPVERRTDFFFGVLLGGEVI